MRTENAGQITVLPASIGLPPLTLREAGIDSVSV